MKLNLIKPCLIVVALAIAPLSFADTTHSTFTQKQEKRNAVLQQTKETTAATKDTAKSQQQVEKQSKTKVHKP